MCTCAFIANPFWHGFCLCGGERRAKTTPTPYGGQGSLFAFANCGIYLLHQRHRTVGSVMAGLVAYGFSP